MRITILTIGSRGDVVPYIALGLGLRRAGHEVRLATHTPFEPHVRAAGLEFAPLMGDPRALLQSERGHRWLASGRNPIRFAAGLARVLRPIVARVCEESAAAAADAEAILYARLVPGAHVAEALDVPGVAAYLQPVSPTRAFPSIRAGGFELGPLGNLLSHLAGEHLHVQPLLGPLNGWRAGAGLPRLGRLRTRPGARRRPAGVLYGYSPSVLPKPPDWGAGIDLCGYWVPPAPAWSPPPALADFLEAGPPPVFIGFGSMTARDPEELAGLVAGALRRAGRRGVVQAGWAGLDGPALGDGAIAIGEAPHAWLFPHMAAVVHHGGAGTTGAGLAAGRPSVIVPFFADQPFWGSRVAALGAGPAPIPRGALTASRLAAAIRTATGDAAIRERAGALGAAIRAEDGVAAAVRALGRRLASAA
jgi:UDP:flavonoid glycosyltransferase YjiC (YdhE family)